MSIGRRLRDARKKKKITLNQAYERTRIHPDILNALEQDEYEKILSPTYIKSFLKEYASYLGLDANEIIEEYNKLELQKPKEAKDFEHPPAKLHNILQKIEIIKLSLKNALPLLKGIIILVLAIVVLRGVVNFTKHIKQKQIAKQSQPKQLKTQTVSKTGKKKAPPEKPPALDSSLKGIVIPKGKELILTVNAIDDVWLQLKVDGKIIFENILKKGSSEIWKAKENFTIWTGKADVLQLTLNGNYIGTAGKGVVKNLVIDRKGIKRP